MAPIKPPPKKALKSMEKKPLDKPISKSKKLKKRSYHSFFHLPLLNFLKCDKRQPGHIEKVNAGNNNFVNDILEKVADDAARMVSHSKKTTFNSRDIQSALKLLISGELAKHANIEGVKAGTMYMNSRSQETTD